MMHEHKEQRAEADAQVKHVGEQPRITELLRVHDPARNRKHATRSEQQVRRVAPPGQVQRRLCGRSVMRAHIFPSATKKHKRLKTVAFITGPAFWFFICAFCAFSRRLNHFLKVERSASGTSSSNANRLRSSARM